MKAIFLQVLTLVALSSGDVAAQTIFKCVQNGKITFQVESCTANAQQNMLRAGVNIPASATPESYRAALAPVRSGASGGTGTNAPAPGTVPSIEVSRTIEFMSTYRACADGVQIFRQEMAGLYDDWRLRNLEMVLRIQSDPQLKALYEQRIVAKRNGPAGMCRSVGLELRGKQ